MDKESMMVRSERSLHRRSRSLPTRLLLVFLISGTAACCERDLKRCRSEGQGCSDQLQRANELTADLRKELRIHEVELSVLRSEHDDLVRRHLELNEQVMQYVDQIPSAFNDHREKVFRQVEGQLQNYDDEVRSEIRTSFELLLAGVGAHIQTVEDELVDLQAKANETLEQLYETKKELTAVRETTERTENTLSHRIDSYERQRETVALRLLELAQSIDEWERSRISCTKKRLCPATLDLRPEKKQAVSRFLAGTGESLQSIQLELSRKGESR